MTLEQALYVHLRDNVTIVGGRVYPGILPQNPAYPALTYAKISCVPERQIGGGQVGYVTSRMQVSCWASTYASAKDVTGQVRASLQSFSGVMGGAGGVEVMDANCVNELDLYEDEAGVWHVLVDVLVTHL